MSLLVDGDGTIQGTTLHDGGYGVGSVFVLTPSGQTYDLSSPHEFTGGGDGSGANSIVRGGDGNIYGVTSGGGANREGTIFSIGPSGTFTTIYSFPPLPRNGEQYSRKLYAGADGRVYGSTNFSTIPGDGTIPGETGTFFRVEAYGPPTTIKVFSCSDGGSPNQIIQASDGTFYGTTLGCGSTPYGTFFHIDGGGLTQLHTFACGDGGAPGFNGYYGLYNLGRVVLGSDGFFYGVAGGCGPTGTFFRIDTAGNVMPLHVLTESEFSGPFSLVEGDDGAFYGMGIGGGFIRLTTSGSVTVLNQFNVTDIGGQPVALARGNDGAFYGVADNEGGNSPAPGFGTVFRVDSSGSLAVLYSFNGSAGSSPYAGLVQGVDGSFYGTAHDGGARSAGTVFRMNPSGLMLMYSSFTGANGAGPETELLRDTDGNFYGTTRYGGTAEVGTAFLIDPSFSLSVLHSFVGSYFSHPGEGTSPLGGVVQAGDGSLYGTTADYDYPVDSNGTVFRIDASGALTTLHMFTGEDGANPEAGLVQGRDGTFYGTTLNGGPGGHGTIFSFDVSGTLTTLHSFNGSDGAFPRGRLVQGTDGNFYGITSGYPINSGTVFRINAAGSLTTLHTFNGDDGAYPWAGLVQGSDGNFYGTTSGGGGLGSPDVHGTVFRIDSSGVLTTLHRFTGSDGENPTPTLVQGSDGSFYGTTRDGGPYASGIAFRLTVPLVCLPAVQILGADAICTGQSVTLDAGAGFSSYLWSTGATTRMITVTPTAMTTYSVAVTGLYGCTGSAALTVTVNPLPSVPMISQTPNADGSVTLTSSSASAYLWSTGATTQAITVSASGQYQVTVTSATGCSATSAAASVALTPTGSGVSAVDGSVTTTFSSVSAGGTTTVTAIDPSTAGGLPSGGYTLSGLGIAYDITTTATYSGNLIIAFVVPAFVDEVTFDSLRVLHGEGSSLIDRTYVSPDGCSPAPNSPCPAPNFATRTIYAQVSSLSPFVLATVPNPFVQTITVPSDPVAVSATVNVQGTFTDPGAHTAVWSWDDDTTSAGTVTESSGHGTVTGNHVYTAAGVYQVTLTVTDSGGASGRRVSTFLVVYDPAGGFVTGGGWINSPAGAYPALPALTGRANFGFVSKYQKGATVPTGETEFEFRAAGMDFHSSTYQWLVISGARAQYKGTGTINGAGNFGFLLTAIDGQASGGGGTDKFRVKIWDISSGVVVYDNQVGCGSTGDNADPCTALSGGSIVIHS